MPLNADLLKLSSKVHIYRCPRTTLDIEFVGSRFLTFDVKLLIICKYL